MCNVFSKKQSVNPVPGSEHLFEKSVRLVGKVVHKSVRHVIVRVYWWNKLADCR